MTLRVHFGTFTIKIRGWLRIDLEYGDTRASSQDHFKISQTFH